MKEFSEEKPVKNPSFIFPAKPGGITETVSVNIFGSFGRKPAFEKALVEIGGEGESVHISLR